MGGDGQRAGKGPSREPPVSSHVSIRSSTRKLDTYKAMSPCMAKHLLKLGASPIREEIKLASKLMPGTKKNLEGVEFIYWNYN